MSDKPVLIAICGKSASGKDTLAKWLCKYLKSKGILCHRIVGETSRPQRMKEKDGQDYTFISENEFWNRLYLDYWQEDYYLEYSNFNNWWYGTPKNQIFPDMVNIGVFSVDGLKSLSICDKEFDILVVYIKCGFIERLKRSINREKKFKFEMLRRAYADEKDFLYINTVLVHFKHLILPSDSVVVNAKLIEKALYKLKLL